jgi:hypothetical protein
MMQVHYQLATSKNGNSSIADYFQKMKLLSDTMATIGQPLKDFETVLYILAGLGSEYDPFVTSITTCVDPLSLEEIYGHLLAMNFGWNSISPLQTSFGLLQTLLLDIRMAVVEVSVVVETTIVVEIEDVDTLQMAVAVALPSTITHPFNLNTLVRYVVNKATLPYDAIAVLIKNSKVSSPPILRHFTPHRI